MSNRQENLMPAGYAREDVETNNGLMCRWVRGNDGGKGVMFHTWEALVASAWSDKTSPSTIAWLKEMRGEIDWETIITEDVPLLK